MQVTEMNGDVAFHDMFMSFKIRNVYNPRDMRRRRGHALKYSKTVAFVYQSLTNLFVLKHFD